MPIPLHHVDLLRIAEDARLALDGMDAAAAGIAAAMRAHTLDPDGAYQLIHLLNEGLKARLDALVAALGER